MKTRPQRRQRIARTDAWSGEGAAWSEWLRSPQPRLTTKDVLTALALAAVGLIRLP